MWWWVLAVEAEWRAIKSIKLHAYSYARVHVRLRAYARARRVSLCLALHDPILGELRHVSEQGGEQAHLHTCVRACVCMRGCMCMRVSA